MTSEFFIAKDDLRGGDVWSLCWLGDCVITEDFACGYFAGWKLVTREFPAGFSSPSHFCLHVKCPLIFGPVLTKIGVCRQILVKLPKMKFHENTLSLSRVFACGQTDRHDDAHKRRDAGRSDGGFLNHFISNESKNRNQSQQALRRQLQAVTPGVKVRLCSVFLFSYLTTFLSYIC